MKTRRAIVGLITATAAMAILAWAGEKHVSLPDMIQVLKAQEQQDGVFRAKLSEHGEVQALFLAGTYSGPEHLRAAAAATALTSLSTGCLRQEAFLELPKVLAVLPRLQKLSFVSPAAKGWDLELFKTIGHLHELRQLRVGYASIPPGALKFLGALPNLEVLELPSAKQLTGKEIECLQNCSKLVELNVRGAHVENDGVQAILGIKSLKFLDIEGTRLSDESRAVLQERGVTVCPLSNHDDIVGSPWRPWME